jgi:hypothetical protein
MIIFIFKIIKICIYILKKKSLSYILRAWFGFFFVAIIFFVCYAMFTLEIQKDSLLYAKFIATDIK